MAGGKVALISIPYQPAYSAIPSDRTRRVRSNDVSAIAVPRQPADIVLALDRNVLDSETGDVSVPPDITE